MELSSSADKLCKLSRDKLAPLPAVSEWPDALDPSEAWYFSPELMTLAGSETLHGLSEERLKRLSFHENINFFSLNIHGERYLMAGLATRMYGPQHRSEYEYLHHFLDEENKHLHYFGTFCQKYAGKIYPDRKLSFASDSVPGEEDFLFFYRVLVFEEIADYFNQITAKDERIHPFVRQLHLMHHLDEVRHLAFGRLVIKDLHARWWTQWSDVVQARVREYAERYAEAVWSEYYSPDMYRDAGFENCYELSRWARKNGESTRKNALRRPRQLLVELGVLTEGEQSNESQ